MLGNGAPVGIFGAVAPYRGRRMLPANRRESYNDQMSAVSRHFAHTCRFSCFALLLDFRSFGPEGICGVNGPVQVRAVRLPSLQDGELVAQEHDLGGLPRFLAAGQPQLGSHPRDQQEDESQAHDR
jgi:hypothetical protein